MGLRLFLTPPDEPLLVPKYPENQLRRDFERVGKYMRKAISEHGGR